MSDIEVTPWTEFKTPGAQGTYRRVGDTMELRCEKYTANPFDYDSFLADLGLRVDTNKGVCFMIEGQIWEVDYEVRVPKFDTVWQKMGFLLFLQDPYKTEVGRKRVYCFYSIPAEGNPEFVASYLSLTVPVSQMPTEDGDRETAHG